jgi:chromate transporter
MRGETPVQSEDLLGLVVVLAPFSLVAIGGGPSIFAPLQHQTVDVRHWLTAREFIDLFAVARAAPGPATMIAALIGWKVGGLVGALVGTIAIFLPSSLLCFGVAKVWNAYRGRPWHTALEQGLAPVAAGLIFAGAMAIFQLANAGAIGGAVALASMAVLFLRPKAHPFIPLVGGAAVFICAVLVRG